MNAVCEQTFKRHEKKYLLSAPVYHSLLDRLGERLQLDQYGQSTIVNLYYDAPDDSLIRRSIQRPAYKEKVRLRSYGVPSDGDPVFIELKKKCAGVVYKRREAAPLEGALRFLAGDGQALPDSQILREIAWVRDRHALSPRVFIACDREAYAADDGLRITFDHDIRFRDTELDLTLGDWGDRLFPGDEIIMEIKTQRAMPLWLTGALTAEEVYPASFSKYGAIYQNYLLPSRREEVFTCAG